jgi:glycosyltransferase involved in cell wall biosynthesis
MEQKNEALLTIVVLTYNHEKWISQLLNSLLNQKTSYDYVIKIFDDFSTDKTREILEIYAKEFPSKVNLILNEKNKGAEKNFFDAVMSVNTEFISFCEGDDIWCNEDKINKQIDFLLKNINIQAIVSDCYLINENDERIGIFSAGRSKYQYKNKVLDPKIYIESSYRTIHISSLTTYSNVFKSVFPNWYLDSPILDTPLLINMVIKYNVFFSDEILAAYRINSNSITHSRGFTQTYLEALIVMFNKLDFDHNCKYKASFARAINNRRIRYYQYLWKRKELKGFIGLLVMTFL